MILLVMTGITIIAITAFKSTILFYEFALERTHHIRQERALEALVFYGITAGYTQKEAVQEYTFAVWPPPKGIYQGTITLIAQEKEWKITAQLFQEKKLLDTIVCQVAVEDTWCITSWHKESLKN